MRWLASSLRPWLLVLLAQVAGCSACTDADTARLEPLPDGAASGTDGGGAATDATVVRPDGGRCPLGLILCGDVCADPSRDRLHCGGCGQPCADGEACVSGSCTCAPGSTCGGSGLGDPNDCGGTSCDALEVCLDGACRCRPGRTRIDGACIDLSTDPDHCGTPGNRCPDGTVCVGGGCHGGCPDGTTDCDGACVRLATDSANCGACGNTCAPDEFCNGGGCDEYRGGTGCSTCPCAACTGDFSTCCAVSGTRGLVACIDADRCP